MREQRFRMLTQEELNELQPEFVKFLIVNGIDADSWQKMQKEKAEDASEMVGIFSDMVIENMLKSTRYLTLVSPQYLAAYHCLAEEIVMVGIRANDEGIDLSRSDYPSQLAKTDLSSLDIHYASKKLNTNREDEMYDLVGKGAVMSDGTDYKNLSMVYASLSQG